MFIPDPDFSPIPDSDPGFRGQKSYGFWIPDPDPQHWYNPSMVTLFFKRMVVIDIKYPA
jgi:hypothetical protein